MATHSSVLAWRIPGMGEPGGLPPMGSHRVRHDRSDLAAAAAAAAGIHFPWKAVTSVYIVTQIQGNSHWDFSLGGWDSNIAKSQIGS